MYFLLSVFHWLLANRKKKVEKKWKKWKNEWGLSWQFFWLWLCKVVYSYTLTVHFHLSRYCDAKTKWSIIRKLWLWSSFNEREAKLFEHFEDEWIWQSSNDHLMCEIISFYKVRNWVLFIFSEKITKTGKVNIKFVSLLKKNFCKQTTFRH